MGHEKKPGQFEVVFPVRDERAEGIKTKSTKGAETHEGYKDDHLQVLATLNQCEAYKFKALDFMQGGVYGLLVSFH